MDILLCLIVRAIVSVRCNYATRPLTPLVPCPRLAAGQSNNIIYSAFVYRGVNLLPEIVLRRRRCFKILVRSHLLALVIKCNSPWRQKNDFAISICPATAGDPFPARAASPDPGQLPISQRMRTAGRTVHAAGCRTNVFRQFSPFEWQFRWVVFTKRIKQLSVTPLSLRNLP